MLGAGANSTGLARGPARRDAVEDCSPYRGTCGCYNLRVFCSQDDLESEGGSPQVERSQSSSTRGSESQIHSHFHRLQQMEDSHIRRF